MEITDTSVLDKLLTEIQSLKELLKQPKQDSYSSGEIKDLATALSKAQGEYKPISFNRENPYFKSSYADLDAVVSAARPALAKYGLCIVQQTRINDDGATIIHTQLYHSSGQWIEARNRIIPPKNDMQTYGSTLTYLRRYAIISLLGITVAGDKSDDDAEVAMADTRGIDVRGTSLNTKYDPRKESFETITREQLEELESELEGYPDIAKQVLDGLMIQSLADVPKDKYSVSARRIREIKMARSGKQTSLGK
jgi:hypothetical protein